ncbi:MAG: hypothetical protein KJ630_01925 [Proteobacteria bacterium]|nr:hypothetical protein [Pseudomonadota bacterium]
MAHQSYAKTVLDKTLELAEAGNGGASCGDISSALFVQTRLQHKRLLNTLCELASDGKLRRISQGVYGPVIGPEKPPDKRQVMWRLFRMRKRVTLDDLMEMAEVSRDYAREWLSMLVKRQVARRIEQPGGHGLWMLINDTLEMPVNEAKAIKLREQRQKKRAITSKLDAIDTALADVRQILSTLEEQ